MIKKCYIFPLIQEEIIHPVLLAMTLDGPELDDDQDDLLWALIITHWGNLWGKIGIWGGLKSMFYCCHVDESRRISWFNTYFIKNIMSKMAKDMTLHFKTKWILKKK